MEQLLASSIIDSSGIKFGTSGARGLVSQFTSEVCSAFTLAFVDVMKASFKFDRVAVGIDLRPSSPRMAAACIRSLEEAGLDVDYCGVLPTPALAHYAMDNEIPSLMVTGSHIPFDRNGLKFYRPDGEISKEDEVKILGSEWPMGERLVEFEVPIPIELANSFYKQRYVEFFDHDVLSGYRVGLYEHSSSARDIFREILSSLGAEVVSLGRTNKFVPIDTEAVSDEDRDRAVSWVSDYSLDCLISTDGDGDRPMISDEKGDWLRGDILGLLCAKYLSVDALAIPVSCNSAVEESGEFDQVSRTRIGSPYVIEGMKELGGFNQVAGFEANGGFLLATNIQTLSALPTRDAVLPVLSVLAASKGQSKTLSELVGALPQRYTASDRIKDFATEKSKSVLARFKSEPFLLLSTIGLIDLDILSMNDTDGLRFTLSNNQVIHLRPSGNAPELRCYCEAESSLVAVELVGRVLSSLQEG